MFLRRLMKDLVLPVAVAISLAFLIQAAVAKPYEIPTPSMEPTIQAGDRIIANRVIYHVRDIERGDIIVFQPTDEARNTCEPGSTDDVPFVKRVIGLPGDRVAIRAESNEVLINGTPLVIANARMNDVTGISDSFTPNEDDTLYTLTTRVPAGKLFVLGDNRSNSCDSHQWSDPFVPIGRVIGQAEVTYWPLRHAKFLD